MYYDGYMEKCAPELESMAGQAPVHKIYSCDELRGLSCPSWMDGRLCTLRSWEMAVSEASNSFDRNGTDREPTRPAPG